MNDLISRQAAIDALFELYEYQRDIDPTAAADLVRQGIFLAEKKIERLPAADPVKHGKFIYVNKGLLSRYECSVCGSVYGYTKPLLRYCENCGARMDGEEE